MPCSTMRCQSTLIDFVSVIMVTEIPTTPLRFESFRACTGAIKLGLQRCILTDERTSDFPFLMKRRHGITFGLENGRSQIEASL